jgi:ketosteroid isomerase-like protein
MNRADAERLAREWIDAWNRLDIEPVLAMYADALSFTSPTAAEVTGTPTVRGKDALRTYWRAALARIGSLKFVFDRITWDHDAQELGIIYTSEIDGRAKKVMELFRFGADGRAVATEVFHGKLPV